MRRPALNFNTGWGAAKTLGMIGGAEAMVALINRMENSGTIGLHPIETLINIQKPVINPLIEATKDTG